MTGPLKIAMKSCFCYVKQLLVKFILKPLEWYTDLRNIDSGASTKFVYEYLSLGQGNNCRLMVGYSSRILSIRLHCFLSRQ